MSDNRRRYRAIKNAIKQLYPTEPRGNTARHLPTLAALISGIVGSKSTNLPALAWISHFNNWIEDQQRRKA